MENRMSVQWFDSNKIWHRYPCKSIEEGKAMLPKNILHFDISLDSYSGKAEDADKVLLWNSVKPYGFWHHYYDYYLGKPTLCRDDIMDKKTDWMPSDN